MQRIVCAIRSLVYTYTQTSDTVRNPMFVLRCARQVSIALRFIELSTLLAKRAHINMAIPAQSIRRTFSHDAEAGPDCKHNNTGRARDCFRCTRWAHRNGTRLPCWTRLYVRIHIRAGCRTPSEWVLSESNSCLRCNVAMRAVPVRGYAQRRIYIQSKLNFADNWLANECWCNIIGGGGINHNSQKLFRRYFVYQLPDIYFFYWMWKKSKFGKLYHAMEDLDLISDTETKKNTFTNSGSQEIGKK